MEESRVSYCLIFRALALALTMLAISGCGFSLRGSSALSGTLPALQLNLQQPNSEIAQLLRRSLQEANIALTDIGDSPTDSSIPVLSVGAEQLDVRPVTVTPRARAAQYDIRIALPVNLIGRSGNLIGPEELAVEQTYYENTGNIVGTQEEIEVIQDEMRRALVNQLLRRLEAASS